MATLFNKQQAAELAKKVEEDYGTLFPGNNEAQFVSKQKRVGESGLGDVRRVHRPQRYRWAVQDQVPEHEEAGQEGVHGVTTAQKG